jgi:hypothetical protein
MGKRDTVKAFAGADNEIVVPGNAGVVDCWSDLKGIRSGNCLSAVARKLLRGSTSYKPEGYQK